MFVDLYYCIYLYRIALIKVKTTKILTTDGETRTLKTKVTRT
jgi:phage antirepressor YoqD-like protein